MPNILHRLSIDAPLERVHELAATKEGIGRWWTSRPVDGEDEVGDRIEVSFSNGEKAARLRGPRADATADHLALRRGSVRLARDAHHFALNSRCDGGTTLLFSHEGWKQENEFMNGCSTNWAAYLMSLKSGAQGDGFHAYPGGEISRWD